MGRFSHEAADIDPDTGIVYLTEDDPSGNANSGDRTADTGSSFLYRFIPANRSGRPGAPPEEFAPRVSGELAEAASRYGMGTLEAAALDRLGVPLA